MVDRRKNNRICSLLAFCFGAFIGFVWGYNCKDETEAKLPYNDVMPQSGSQFPLDSVPYNEIKYPQSFNDTMIVCRPDTLFRLNNYLMK